MSFATIFTLVTYFPMAFTAWFFVFIGVPLFFLQTTQLMWGNHLQAVHMIYWPGFCILLGMESSFQNFRVDISVILMRQARRSLPSSLITWLLDKSVLAASNHTMSTVNCSREFPAAFLLSASIWSAKFLLSWCCLPSVLTNETVGTPCSSMARSSVIFWSNSSTTSTS